MVSQAQIPTRFLYKLAQDHRKEWQDDRSLMSLNVAAHMFEFHCLLLLPAQKGSANVWCTG